MDNQNLSSTNSPKLNAEAPTFVPTNQIVPSNPFLPPIRPRLWDGQVIQSDLIERLHRPQLAMDQIEHDLESFVRTEQDHQDHPPPPPQQETNGRMPPLMTAMWNERLFVTSFLALCVAFIHLIVFIMVALNR